MKSLLWVLEMNVLAIRLTLGFSWGRTFIFSRCIILIALGIKQSDLWQKWLSTNLLLACLTIDIRDLSPQHRQLFPQVAALLEQDFKQNFTVSTLVAFASQVWRHVDRLAYYIPDSLSGFLLSSLSPILATALQKPLALNDFLDQRVLWLESETLLQSLLKANAERQQVEILSDQFQFIYAKLALAP
jgi:hypothetical protein